MAELQTIEMVIEDENENGVYALSLVDDPANKDETVLLSADNIKVELSEVLNENQLTHLSTANEEKRLIVGLVLEPDTPIYRNNNGREYNITFKAHTVEKASYMYMAQLNNNNVTVQHDKPVSGVSVVESWIVLDSQKDKSALFGKSYKVGSWAVVLKVHDPAKWEEYKANGTTNISLEGVFKPKQKSTLETKLSILKSAANEL